MSLLEILGKKSDENEERDIKATYQKGVAKPPILFNGN